MKMLITLIFAAFASISLFSQEKVNKPRYTIKKGEIVFDFNFYNGRYKMGLPSFFKNGPDIRGWFILVEESTSKAIKGIKLSKKMRNMLFKLTRNGRKIPVQIIVSSIRDVESAPGRIHVANAYDFLIPIETLRVGEYQLSTDATIICGKKIRIRNTTEDTPYRNFKIIIATTKAELELQQMDIAQSKKSKKAIKYISNLLTHNKIANEKNLKTLMSMMFYANLEINRKIDAAAWLLCCYRSFKSYNPMIIRMIMENSFKKSELFNEEKHIEAKVNLFKRLYLQNVQFHRSPEDLNLKTIFAKQDKNRDNR